MSNTVLLAVTIKVGLFGFTTATEEQHNLNDLTECISRLDRLEERYAGYEKQRVDTVLKVTDKGNYTIRVWKCT